MAATPLPLPKQPTTTANKAKKAAIAAAIATAIAVPMEGIHYVAYYDPPGILTTCYGSTTNVVKGKIYSPEECKTRLTNDMMTAVRAVDKCVPDAPDSVLAAFSDAAYNIGPKVACDTRNSTAARMLKAKDWKGACQQLLRWNKTTIAGVLVSLNGLTKRRTMERDVCIQGL